VLVSDTESWVYGGRPWTLRARGASGVMDPWQQFVKNQRRLAGREAPAPKLTIFAAGTYTTSQAPERDDVLHVGGFSDAVSSVVASFLLDDPDRLVRPGRGGPVVATSAGGRERFWPPVLRSERALAIQTARLRWLAVCQAWHVDLE